VLDIGGWAMPFNRADYVIDIESYETRGMFGSQGPEREYFSKETWITRDLCDRALFPFPDKYFDYVICSHTLEDIRDPIFVCSEINRIGKRGYIEVPSMRSELMFGTENKHYAGRSHHRWLVDIRNDEVCFAFKYHHIHSYWEFHLPKPRQPLTPAEQVQFLFWEHHLKCKEHLMVTRQEIDSFLISNVNAYGGHSVLRRTFERARTQVKQRLKGIMQAIKVRRAT
jgi:SAM-dependent methyltransferase